MVRYRKVYQAFNDLNAGLLKAQHFYAEMKETTDSLEQNVETFVNNRRLEGAQLLSQIERDRADGAAGQADRERERLRELMERMSMDPSASPPAKSGGGPPPPRPPQPVSTAQQYSSNGYSAGASRYAAAPAQMSGGGYAGTATSPPPSGYAPNGSYAQRTVHDIEPSSYAQHDPYHPTAFARRDTHPHSGPVSPPMNHHQQPYGSPGLPPPSAGQYPSYASHPGSQPHTQPGQTTQYNIPPGYVPPPPPPGPPPLGPQQSFPTGPGTYTYGQSPPIGTGGQSQGQRRPSQSGGGGDPWAGLNAWR